MGSLVALQWGASYVFANRLGCSLFALLWVVSAGAAGLGDGVQKLGFRHCSETFDDGLPIDHVLILSGFGGGG
jgi:hypothetical protein